MRALAHCHSHCIAHRDVKPQNVLVDPSADHLKLCDFSLSHRLVVPVDAQTRRVASLWYRSPEILLGGPPSAFPLDMWSVGCLNAEMLAHCPLFPGGSEIETLFLQFGRLGTPTEETWPGTLNTNQGGGSQTIHSASCLKVPLLSSPVSARVFRWSSQRTYEASHLCPTGRTNFRCFLLVPT